MNLDLASQLLAGFSPSEIGLRDNLERPRESFMLLCLDWLDSAHLVALGKAAFAKEAKPLIGDNLARFVVIFGIHRLYFLFDNLNKQMIS